MLETISSVNDLVNGIVWGWPALILLSFVGVLTTCITKGFQLTHFNHWWSMTIGAIFKDKHVTSHTADKSITSCTDPEASIANPVCRAA